MSLPQAMRALERGEIARPADGDLTGMVLDAELPPSRPPPPRRSRVLDEIHAEAVANAEIVRREMAHTIAAKRGISVQAALDWIKENENAG
jgi:hypothetical protein